MSDNLHHDHRGIQKARGSIKDRDLFLETLWNIIKKEQRFIDLQVPRFKKLWNMHLVKIEPKPHIIRPLNVGDKELFISSNENKVKVLENLEACIIDGFYSVHSIFTTLFQKYFNNSALFLQTFNGDDREIVKYMAAEKLTGSLLQYLKEKKDVVPLKLIIVSLNKTLMKLKGMDDVKIQNKLKKAGFDVNLETIQKIMQELADEGYVSIKGINNSGASNDNQGQQKYLYQWVKDFKLSKEGEKAYKDFINPLLEWAIQLWRTMYNIREMDVNVPETYPNRNTLLNIVKKAATQGFRATYFVVKNIKEYYKKV
ncbi:MAG: hypothetical protein ACTSU2_06985 [Promethearchaeota archaeon]